MSQINSECLFFDDTDDETEVNSLLSGFLIDAALVIQASTPTIQKYQRSYMPRDRYGAHDRLVLAYFAKKPFYNAYLFRKRFRMNRSLFTRIVRDLSANCPYFQEGCDAVGKAGISALVKCTSAIRQLAYAAVPDSLDEYLQIGEKTSRDCLMHFCNGVIELYGEEYLRRPTQTDVEKLYAFHENKHGFLGMIDSIDCKKWPLNVHKHIVLNSVGVIPEWAVLMKSILQPGSNDVKRIRYKQAHEAARKDVERAFGVLKKKMGYQKGKAISPDFYPEEQHREDDPVRSAQDRLRVIREIHDE
ncbi:protein translocase subunit SecA2, chloroplastic isoform X1 [Tanacetum coccineum]